MSSSCVAARRTRCSTKPGHVIANEEEKRARFEAGELGLDVYDMRERLAGKGLRYVESETGD